MQGNFRVLDMVKSLIDNPMLISLSPGWGISLEVEQYSQNGNAEVSQLPVIAAGSDTKQFLYDNVAPHGWTWQLSGHIPGQPLIEMTNLFTPIVQMNTDFLRKAYKNGSRCVFKDVDQQIYTNVVIQDLTIDMRADEKNKRPFTMTLVEIVEIKAELADLTETEKNSIPNGDTISDMGANATSTPGASTLKQMLSKLTSFFA